MAIKAKIRVRRPRSPHVPVPRGIETFRSRANLVSIHGRTGRPHGTATAQVDQFGLPALDDRYRYLGPRCRQNIATALAEGIVYAGTSGTVEEMVCYGELRRRGFVHGKGQGETVRYFEFQADAAGGRSENAGGSVVDFEVWDQGRHIALRPQNTFWHGGLGKVESDEERADTLKQQGFAEVLDIWSGDMLNDYTLEMKFNDFFGAWS